MAQPSYHQRLSFWRSAAKVRALGGPSRYLQGIAGTVTCWRYDPLRTAPTYHAQAVASYLSLAEAVGAWG